MKKYSLLVIVVIFLFIYEPPIISINVLHIIGVFSWVYIIFNNKVVSKVMKWDSILKIYGVLTLFWIYLVLVALINGNPLGDTLSFLFWIIDIFPTCIMLSVYFSKKKYTLYDFLNILLMVGTLQGIMALGAFLSPTLQEAFVTKLLNYGYSNTLDELTNLRMFGFSSNLTYTTPIVQSVLTIISLYLAINKKWTYLLFSPLLFYSAVINARTTFIITLIGILSIIIISKKVNTNLILRLPIIATILFITLTFGTSLLKENSNETYQWVATGYDEILQLFKKGTNQDEGYFAYIDDPQRYKLPEGFGILFGNGIRILQTNNYGARSDIGYINDIWLGGILYSIFLYLFFIFMMYLIGRKKYTKNRETKFLYYFLLGAFFVSNIKGYIFGMNNLTNLIFLIFTFIVLRKVNYRAMS